MINVMLTGVGGQGTVLAAKVLAQAAQEKGWAVRTAETIGMAQRGGSVVSHVRMCDQGENTPLSLIAKGSADVAIAFEPAEGARILPYLKPDGVLISAQTPIQPVTAALSDAPYQGAELVAQLREAFAGSSAQLVLVPDGAILQALGNRRALNTVLVASAVIGGYLPLTVEELKAAIAACVKPQYVDMNLQAINLVASLSE